MSGDELMQAVAAQSQIAFERGCSLRFLLQGRNASMTIA